MGKNKPCRNSFYHFMMDFKAKQPRNFENMQAVAMAAGPHWERMTTEQRQPYEEKAKKQKHGQKVIKYTTTGQNIALVQKRENERVLKEQRMKDNIENMVRIAVETGRICDEMFYFIHVNHFCYCNTDRRHYPAEIAVARFTLREGVTTDNIFHMIIKPGSLPLGYSFQAKQTSEETHQLHAPMGSDDENNTTQVMNGFMKFMTGLNSNEFSMPPVYADAKNRPIVENVLQNFCLDFGHDEGLFKVYSMEHLLYILRNSVSEKPVWPVVSMSILELEKDIYDFCREIACVYHENSDVPNHCSRSHVIRSAYIVCDNCCRDVGIDLIPGQHVPRQAKVAGSRPQSRASSVSSVAKPSHRHQPFAQSGYLSVQESEISEMSETSTVVDPNDVAALGGYESEFSQTDVTEVDDWIQPKQKHKKQNKKLDLCSDSMNSKPTDLSFQSVPEMSGMTQANVRRPVTLSAALSQMSMSSSPGPSSGSMPKIGRGRGRGIAANFGNKMT